MVYAERLKSPRRSRDKFYRHIQLGHQEKKSLIEHFLSEFAKVIVGAEDRLNNFDVVKKKLTLVVRPTDLYEEVLARHKDKPLALSLPILPDLALYWAVEEKNTWQYISHIQFSEWNTHWIKVMGWAYENTCNAEKYMHTAEIGDVGVLISTARRNGTIAHLLWESRNLQRIIQSTRPDWHEQAYWVCIPVPHLIIVTRKGYDHIIREIAAGAHHHFQNTPALSNRIYVFENLDFTGEVIRNPGQKEPTIVTLQRHIPEPVLPDERS